MNKNIFGYIINVFIWSQKADNYILSIVSRVNGRIRWIVRNFISRETNVILEIYKTLIRPHIEYCTQAWATVSRHGY